MTYTTILTTKGTTTIPKEIRDLLGVKPGMRIEFTRNKTTGEFVVGRAQTISELRKENIRALKKAKTIGKQYVSGAGYTTHVAE